MTMIDGGQTPVDRTGEAECSPTPPPSSTDSADGGPLSPEQPKPDGEQPTASAETREITYSAQVPNVDPPFDVECTMRLVQHARGGRPELWSVGVPQSASTRSREPRPLPPSVYVDGRARGEALCRALAVNYAIHVGECMRSDMRFQAHTRHYLGEAGVDG